jgi:hypothetical protein
MPKGVMDIYLIYEFLRRLTTPFEKWDAYKTGVIDKNGKVVASKEDRTPEQEKSWGYYDRLLANLKKLLGKVPLGKTRVASFAAALLLLREQNIDADNVEELQELLNDYMGEAQVLTEELTNVVGGGKIAGIGVGPDGEPGVPPAAHRKHKKKAQQSHKEKVREIAKMLKRNS